MSLTGYMQDLLELNSECLTASPTARPLLLPLDDSLLPTHTPAFELMVDSSAPKHRKGFEQDLNVDTRADMLLLDGLINSQPQTLETQLGSSPALTFNHISEIYGDTISQPTPANTTFNQHELFPPIISTESCPQTSFTLDTANYLLPMEQPLPTTSVPELEFETDRQNKPLSCPTVPLQSLDARLNLYSEQELVKDLASHNNGGPDVQQPSTPHTSLHNAERFELIRLKNGGREVENANLGKQKFTTLSARTTEDVIADLRNQSSAPKLRLHGGESRLASSADLILNSNVEKFSARGREGKPVPNIHDDHTSDNDLNNIDENGEDDYAESSDDMSNHSMPLARQRKLTERKKRLNATVDNFIQDWNQKAIKEGVKLSSQEESQQSARWLVNQSENRKIISSPREYQLELFEKAKERNIIAVLDTGSGKTLIAVLLLRHVFAQELEDRAMGKPRRIAFFLVDSVQLVFQQHAVLKANLDQPMNMFCGDMGCDLWNRNSWEKHFAENMVIVCTAEVLRQCLHHSFISMEQINLLIFDEAHHAKKDHPYARIIKDFYVPTISVGRLPKIFGMTASPVDARVDVRKAAAELEAILYCEIATAADLSLLQYTIQSKQESVAWYNPPGPAFETALFTQMNERFRANHILNKALTYAREATRELGSWCSDQVWPFCLTEEETKKLQAKTERQYHVKKIQEPLSVLDEHKTRIKEARDILKAWDFDQPHYSYDLSTKSCHSTNLSNKVVVLISLLKDRYQRTTDDKCIVFVRQRYTARLLAKLFAHQHIGTKHLRVGTLVGTRTGDAGDLNVSFREQVVTMMNFRKGTVNCLFATSVAEEGLDVPDCNLVIRFDLYSTLIQYIQSRGRARHANSRYFHMAERGNQEHSNIMMEVRSNENKLKEFCVALPEDRKLTGNDFDMDHFLAKERTHRVWKHPETGAKLTYKMSLMVLSNFVDSLPRSPESTLQPEYVVTVQNKQFVCEVILPEGSPVRGEIGRPATTKQVAKCSAAFETCLALVKGKYINEWLLPTFTKQLPAMRNAALAVNSKKLEAYDMITKPKLWSLRGYPEELFVTVLSLGTPESVGRPSQPLALLTRHRLPELPTFFLHFGGERHSKIICTPLQTTMRVSEEVIKTMNTFTMSIFWDVFSKLYESDPSTMPYFLVPVASHNLVNPGADPATIISWDILQVVQEYDSRIGENHWKDVSWRTEPDEYFEDKYIVDPYDGSRKMWSIGVTHEYKPLDPVPPDSVARSGSRKKNDNIMEYSCSLWAKARAKTTLDPNQRVIKTEHISLRRNLLDEFDSTQEEKPKDCLLIMECLKISPLPTTVVAMAYMFPAIIHRIESYLIALEAAELLHLKIRPDLALEAVTKDSDNSGEHDQEQMNFQRGMGNNYERLEFLGDCFLKMATSISLYGLHPDNDEYRYHVDRMLLICNKNLKNNAIKMKLYQYIRSQSFNRRAWYPEGLVIKKGKQAPAPNTHKLGDKSIADVCEAFIGAALLTCHESKDMDNAVRAVSEVVCSENHNVVRFCDYYKLYTKPKYQLAQSTASQLDLAKKVENEHPYHFKYPRLVRSAFTHPSYPFSYEQVPSYQRLEFLGDSLLDMACVNFLFHNFPGKDPQWLTEHKMAMVSNQFLGALCVSLGFHTHLLVFHAGVQKQISDYVVDVTEARKAAEEDAIRIGKGPQDCAKDYWVHVRQPPKCLPDIVEAYIGAIFVDSEYEYPQVERFFDMHIKWYFKDMGVYDTFANKHPTTFLTHRLQVELGCLDWSLMTRELPSVDGSKPTVVGLVLIHNEIRADAKAESSRYAKVNAAKKAVDLLSSLSVTEFKEKYHCECRPDEEEEIATAKSEDMHDLHGTAV